LGLKGLLAELGDMLLQSPLYGSPADAKDKCQLFYPLTLGRESLHYLTIPLPLKPALPASRLIIDTFGEGTIKTRPGKLATLITIVAVLWWQIQLISFHPRFHSPNLPA